MDHFYKQILDESPVGYSYHRMIYDEEGTPSDYEFIEINRAFEEYTGLKREDVIGRRIREIMPKIVYDEFDWIGYYGDVALNGGKSEFEQFEETLGRYYRVNVFSPGKDHFVTLFTDISKEKKDLIENVTLITALNDAIFTLDTNLKFQQILVPDDSYFLFLKEEAAGKNIWEVFPQDFNDVIIRKCLEAEMTGQKVWAEYQFPFDDEGRWFRAEFKAIVVDRKGRYVINLCDVTEQKRYELDLISKERELDHFFSVNPELLSITDLEGNFLKLNKAWETTLGYRLDFLQGKSYLEWIHKEDAEAISQSYSQLQDKNTPLDFVSRYVCADGAYKYLEWRAQLSDDRIYAAARDITDRKRSEEALFLEKEKYEMTLLSIGDGVISIDADKKIRFMNTVAEQLTGWSTEEAMGHPFEEVFPIINQNTRNKVENPAWEVLKTGNIIGLANHTLLIRRDGTEIAIEDSAAPIRDKDGWIEGVVLVFRDVTDRIKAREKIEYLSQHDFLTGLYNRMYFEKQLRETDREENLPISLIVIDVNGLKLTNDAFGHDKGDQLLKAIAEIIRDDIREQDICARIGGDEFAIILPETTHLQAEKMRTRIGKDVEKLKLGSVVASVAIGCETKKYKSYDISSTFKLAENHMYKDKLKSSRTMRNQTLKLIVDTLNNEYEKERAHTDRVSRLCHQTGLAMELSPDQLRDAELSGFLHDVGKIVIPYDLLNKPEKLTAEEYEIVKSHTESGYHILKSIDEFSPLAEFVLSHHEHWNGKGYPRGLKGEEIPLISRIISVADSYEAMTADRPYRKAMDREKAIAELNKNAGVQFDPEIIRIFVDKVIPKEADQAGES